MVTSRGISVLVVGERNTAGALRVIAHVEFGGGRHVAAPRDTAAHHDDPADHRDQLGVAAKGTGDIGQRSERHDGHLVGRCPHHIADDFFRRVLVMEFGDNQPRVAQPVVTVEGPSVDGGGVFQGRGHAQAWKTWRVQLVDNRLHVAIGLLCPDVALGGGDGLYLQTRIEQGQAQGDCVVDARIAVNDQLSGYN